MNKSTIVAAAAACATFGMSAAGAVEGPYVGGAAMQSRFDSNKFSVDDVDNEDTGWKAILGVRMTPHFAVEGSYVQFGRESAPSVPAFEAKAKAFSLFGVGLWEAGPVDLFLKAGAGRINAEGNSNAVFFKDHDTVFAYGAGVQLRMNRLEWRAEYEKFNTDVVGDLDVISLGLTYSFGAP